MPASLILSLPLLFAPVQPPGDGVAPAFPGQDPPQPDTSQVSPFDDLPADSPFDDPVADPPAIDPGADPFADPPMAEPDANPFGEPEPPAPIPSAPAPPPEEVDPFDAPAPPREPSVGAPMQDPDGVPPVILDPGDVPPRNPLLDEPIVPADDLPDVVPAPPVELPLDPADPDVVVIEEPAVTVITQPNPLADLIRNPYDIYDLREHAAVPADCLLARQACLPCTRSVTTCAPCGCGTLTETLPVPGVNPYAAEQIGQILLERTPADPRVSYLMFVLRYREGRYDEAFGFLEEAVRLEQANPDAFLNYAEFMTPIQGRSRVYLERVRRLAGLGVI